MGDITEDPIENADNQRENNKKVIGKPFPPGVSGNPKGRPKGKTIKERVRDWLEEHPGDMEDFVKHFVEKNKELAWQMLEGRPSQSLDLGNTSDSPFLIQIVKDDRDTTTTDPGGNTNPQS